MTRSHPLRQFRSDWKLNTLFSTTNPKVLKSDTVAPTLVLHFTPVLYGACPAAGTCRSVCLHTAGNKVYLSNKVQCRARRSEAFHNEREQFCRLIVLEAARMARKGYVGIRLNGTSDHRWEAIPVTITPEDSAWMASRYGVNITPGQYDSILEPLISMGYQPYDYTKRVDRDWAKCKELGYHITMSHGSIHDTLAVAIGQGVNYAAGFYGYGRKRPLPQSITILGQEFPILDGDLTDWRPGDDNHRTHVIGLRMKRTPGQTEAQARAFCLAGA